MNVNFQFSSAFSVDILSSASISSLMFVSISTSPFLSELEVLIPTLISAGFILNFNNPLILSGVWFSTNIT